MSWLLLESLLGLLAALLAVQFLLISLWSWRRSPTTGRAVWIGFLAMPILLLTSWLVITPRERLLHICREIALHAELKEVDAIGNYFSSNVDADGWDRHELLENIDRVLSTYRLERTTFSGFEVTAQGNEHVAEFGASCDISTRDGDLQRLPTAWRLTFRRSDQEWEIIRVESVPVPPLQIRDLQDLMRR